MASEEGKDEGKPKFIVYSVPRYILLGLRLAPVGQGWDGSYRPIEELGRPQNPTPPEDDVWPDFIV